MMSKSGAPSPTATKAEVLDRVRAIIPKFRERAEAAEQARRIPDESVRDMLGAGLARILMPPRFGGYGLGLDTWYEVMREISKADASHGWCAGLMIHHPHYVAQFPLAAQEAIWADGPDVSVAGSVIPQTKIVPVDGGFRVSGKSPFASGVSHSPWVFVGGMVQSDDGPEWTLFLLEPGQYTVSDTWFTAGMCATGSNTIVTENAFVPESRTVRLSSLREGAGPGGAVHEDPIYRAPLIAYSPICFATPMLGAVQGAYEYFRDWTRTRVAGRGVAVAELASTQSQMARAAASLDAAELLMRRIVETVRLPIPLELRARSMRDFSRVSELAMEAIDALMALSGSAGFTMSNPIQRAWRDLHFASMHISLSIETNYTYFGRMEFGLPRDPHQPFY